MVLEWQSEHESQWAVIGLVAAKPGCTSEMLRKWVRHAEGASEQSPLHLFEALRTSRSQSLATDSGALTGIFQRLPNATKVVVQG